MTMPSPVSVSVLYSPAALGYTRSSLRMGTSSEDAEEYAESGRAAATASRAANTIHFMVAGWLVGWLACGGVCFIFASASCPVTKIDRLFYFFPPCDTDEQVNMNEALCSW